MTETVTYKSSFADFNQRLDVFCAQAHEGLSRSKAQAWIEAGHVLVDGQPQSPKFKLKPNQTVSITPQLDASASAALPEKMALPIEYEDDAIIVINKPAGLLVHPGSGQPSGTLMNGLLAHHANAASLPRAGIVHRLDQHTSGLMVIAKTLAAYNDLVAQLKARSVSRQYLALVQGSTQWHTLTIEAEIGRDPRNRTKMALVKEGKGKPAITHASTLARSLNPAVSLVQCRLHTGRTHQIRVHLAAQRHSLVGDSTYGGRAAHGFNEQALHAFALALTQPESGERLYFTAAPPENWQAVLTELNWQGVLDEALDCAFTAELEAQAELDSDAFDDDDFDDDDDDHDVEIVYTRD